MKVSRRSGGVRVRLDAVEAVLLAQLFTDLADAVDSDAFEADDPVRERLYPAAYADDEAAAEFRELTEGALRTERVDRARQCADQVSHEVQLDREAAQRWIQALNDLRLALGTRLGVTEDDVGDLHGDAQQAEHWAIYHWLTGLQELVVQALMR